eukprot:6208278-Pleurochrysis_carterae.AAC.3
MSLNMFCPRLQSISSSLWNMHYQMNSVDRKRLSELVIRRFRPQYVSCPTWQTSATGCDSRSLRIRQSRNEPDGSRNGPLVKMLARALNALRMQSACTKMAATGNRKTLATSTATARFAPSRQSENHRSGTLSTYTSMVSIPTRKRRTYVPITTWSSTVKYGTRGKSSASTSPNATSARKMVTIMMRRPSMSVAGMSSTAHA